ncbi:MAG TPA: class I SAM-dependent methyltransferase [Oligoflexia bacterium]|nr:class I SAM-dependent methyltransferase [Oligoflexia bacterium]HMP48108.1 class I SAM-dependent methyltransferase [Oligoflexia bacterium]
MNWSSIIGGSLIRESEIHPHCPEEMAEHFSALEGGSVELELMDFLYGTVRLFKPRFILETGTHFGISAVCLGTACKINRYGKVISIESDPEKAEEARKLLARTGLNETVEVLNGNSLNVISNLSSQNIVFDFTFLDSSTPIRPQEFELLYCRGLIKNLVAFHDTSRTREKTFRNNKEPQQPYIDAMDEIERLYCRGGIENQLSRGFRLMQLKDL